MEEAQHVVIDCSGKLPEDQRVTSRPVTAEDLVQRELDAIEETRLHVARARAQRNALLAQSDWTQLPDVKLPIKRAAAWAKYRQALRDMTFEGGDLVWPDPPQ